MITGITKSKILETTYAEGKRISHQEIEYTIVDDLWTLSNLYNQWANLEDSYSKNFTTVDNFTIQRDEIQAGINEYNDYVAGYTKGKVAENA